jgi:hypothetical protein
MGARLLLSIVLMTSAFGAEKMTAPHLIESARTKDAALPGAITTTFDAKELKGRQSQKLLRIDTLRC